MWLLTTRCTSKARLDGKTAVVTGCNTGIGKVTVKELAKRGCRVIMACRDVTKADAAADEIRKETQGVEGVGEIVVVSLNLSSFAAIRQCASHLLQTEPHVNLLINNAGVAMCPKNITEDGFELQFGTNHLGHFLFTLLLLPRILKSTPARIVMVSSMLHVGGSIDFDDVNLDKPKAYGATSAYNRSKLANILFAKELGKRLEGTGVTTYSLHPGAVHTDVGRHLDDAYCAGSTWIFNNVLSLFYKTPEQGAQTTIYCAVDEDIANQTGEYYAECKKTTPYANACDMTVALRLWEESIKWAGLDRHDPFTPDEGPPATHTDKTDKTHLYTQ